MSRGILQMTRLSRQGRFANAIIEYAFLAVYCYRHNLELQVPHWIGETIFGFQDARPDRKLPVFQEKEVHGIDDTLIPHLPEPLCNVDVNGYFQFHGSYFAPDKDFIQELFAHPVQSVADRMAPAIAKLRDLAPRVIGLHLRRGDFGLPGSSFYLTPTSWYLELLDRIWTEDSALFIASDDLNAVNEFAKFNPVTATSLGITFSADAQPGICHLQKDLRERNAVALDMFPDWELLRHCDVIGMGNSTYGFTAAWLSTRCRQAFRSNLDTRRLDEMDPWDSFPSQFIDAKKYAHVPGIWLNSNGYW